MGTLMVPMAPDIARARHLLSACTVFNPSSPSPLAHGARRRLDPGIEHGDPAAVGQVEIGEFHGALTRAIVRVGGSRGGRE